MNGEDPIMKSFMADVDKLRTKAMAVGMHHLMGRPEERQQCLNDCKQLLSLLEHDVDTLLRL